MFCERLNGKCRIVYQEKIMKTFVAVLFFLIVVSAQAADQHTDRAKQILKRFPDADLNGDGILTREEFKEYRKKNGLQSKQKITPTLANVSYAPHTGNVIDFYKARSTNPTPLVLYIHGGGFKGGSKDRVSQQTLQQLLNAGISVASIEYRLIGVAPLPAAHHDCARALQFVRTKDKEWNFDKTKVAAFGGSAGAQLSMWLAFHDDMKNPKSADPVQRESTRLSFVATSGGQSTMDLNWWVKNIPGYEKPHSKAFEYYKTTDEKKIAEIIKEISVINHLTKDDPPIFMRYRQDPTDPVPDNPKIAKGWSIHHVQFGITLKKKMDKLGIEADLKYPNAKTTYDSEADFFIKKFQKK